MLLWSDEWHQAFSLAEEFARQDCTSRNTSYLLLGLATAKGPGYGKVFGDADLPLQELRDLARQGAVMSHGRGPASFWFGRMIRRSLLFGRPRPDFDDYDMAAECFLADIDHEMREGRIKRPFDGGHLSFTVLQPPTQATSALESLGLQTGALRELARQYIIVPKA